MGCIFRRYHQIYQKIHEDYLIFMLFSRVLEYNYAISVIISVYIVQLCLWMTPPVATPKATPMGYELNSRANVVVGKHLLRISVAVAKSDL